MWLNYLEIKVNFSLKFSFIFAGKLALCNSIMLISLICVLILGGGVGNTILAIIVAATSYFISLNYFDILNKKEKALLKYTS
jgi:hypothetical protein